jgi:hypothetical protein
MPTRLGSNGDVITLLPPGEASYDSTSQAHVGTTVAAAAAEIQEEA